MNRYLTIARTYLDAALVYRLNFSLWRLRNIFTLLTLYYLWLAVFGENTTLFNYSAEQMLTYVFLSSFLKASILSSRAVDIVGEIHSGSLSNLLVKPISVIKYYFARDLSDKIFNISFSVVETALLLFIFRPALFLVFSPLNLFLTLLAVGLGFIFNFFLNFVIGAFGFWVQQVWPVMFIAQLFGQIVSGALFPLDVLPTSVTKILYLTPFPYLIFFPTNIYLNRFTGSEILLGFLTLAFWTAVAFLLTQTIWKKGIKNYAAFGN